MASDVHRYAAMKYAVLCGIATATVAYGDPQPLRARDAVRIAVERYPGLIAKRVDVDIASDRVQAARGAQDFLFGANATWDGARSRGDTALPSTDTLTAGGSLTRPLPGGGSLGMETNVTVARERSSAAAAGTGELPPVDRATAEVLLVVRQPLLRGRNGDAAPRTALARSVVARDITQLERVAAASTLVRDVIRAYWELVLAQRVLEIKRSSLGLAREQMRITRARVASGRIAESETLAVGQAIAVREDEVAQAEANLVQRSIELAQFLGRDVIANILVEPTEIPDIDTVPRDLAAEVAFARERSPDLATVRARGKAAAIEVEVTQNGMLPSLDLEASGGLRGEGVRPLRAWSEVGDASRPVFSVGVELTVPLGNRAGSGAHAAAVNARRRVKLDEQALAAQIEAAVVAAVTNMRTARARIASLDQALALGDEGIRAERARWEAGKSTNYDVMRRQEEREQTALRLSRARVDLLEAEAALDAVTGAILPRYHVELAR